MKNEEHEIDKTRLVRTFVQYKRSDESEFTTINAGAEIPQYEWFEQIEIIRQSVYKEIAEGMKIDKQTTKSFYRKPSEDSDAS